VPAAAVIPAPEAYTHVVAAKKLVAGFLCVRAGLPAGKNWCRVHFCHGGPGLGVNSSGRELLVWPFTVKKLECSKQAIALHTR